MNCTFISKASILSACFALYRSYESSITTDIFRSLFPCDF